MLFRSNIQQIRRYRTVHLLETAALSLDRLASQFITGGTGPARSSGRLLEDALGLSLGVVQIRGSTSLGPGKALAGGDPPQGSTGSEVGPPC